MGRMDVEVGPLRQLLLALLLFGSAGLLVELFLLDHTESGQQWIPFGVLAGGLAAGLWLALRPGKGALEAFRAAMALYIASGLLGIVLHYLGNSAFEREMDASAHGLALVWIALSGATPALAPGAMVQLGLLGLILAYRHPAARRGSTGQPEEPGTP